ncbi:MAG TPA: zinc metalloprotease HtpX [Firmicutes bacterium]|nr:zinc metalloprotease HtpX [Bacillota bacterium]
MASRRNLGADFGLSLRMLFTMFLLLFLYSAFMWVLWQAGVGFSAIVIVVGVMLAIQYFYSDKLVLMSTRAKVVSPAEEPQLHAVVERLAAMAGLPTPRIAVMDTDVPNAYATGRSPRHAVVAVTRGLMQRLDWPEIEAVLAHELAHIKNRDMSVLTLASFFATVASVIMQNFYYMSLYGRARSRNDRNNQGAAIVLVWLASVAVYVISYFLIRALSRYREYAADRGSAILTGAPSQLMSALTKISGVMSRIPETDLRQAQGVNAFFIIPAIRGEALMELFSTHPSLERRLAHLRKIEQEMRG